MSDDEERGRSDLIKAIMGALPIDPETGTCHVEYMGRPLLRGGGRSTKPLFLWGDPQQLAHRILDALDEAYTHRDLQQEFAYMKHEGEDPF